MSKRIGDWHIIDYIKGFFEIERSWMFPDRNIPLLYEKKFIDENIAKEIYGISEEQQNNYKESMIKWEKK